VRAAESGYRDAGLPAGPTLAYEHQADGQDVPTRLVLNFLGKVTDYEPGDYLAVTIAKAPPAGPVDATDVPF
jgi:hypothetical protein